MSSRRETSVTCIGDGRIIRTALYWRAVYLPTLVYVLSMPLGPHCLSLSLADRSDRGPGGADPVRGYPRAALSIWPYGLLRAPSEALHAADEKKAENEARAASSKPQATRGRRRRRKSKKQETRAGKEAKKPQNIIWVHNRKS